MSCERVFFAVKYVKTTRQINEYFHSYREQIPSDYIRDKRDAASFLIPRDLS